MNQQISCESTDCIEAIYGTRRDEPTKPFVQTTDNRNVRTWIEREFSTMSSGENQPRATDQFGQATGDG